MISSRTAPVLLLVLGLVVGPLAAQAPPKSPAPPKTPAPAPGPPPKRPPPPTLAERYLSSWLQLFPTEAAARGDHSKADQLEDLPPMRLRAWLNYNKSVADEVDKRLADPAIQGEERLDLYVLRDQTEQEILTYDTLKRPQHDPLYWTSLLSQATVFQLVREDRPAAERLEAAARRAEKLQLLTPQVVASLGSGDPDQIPPEHLQEAIELVRPLAEFYRQGFARAADQLPAGPKRTKMAQRLQQSGEKAAAALESLIPFFERLQKVARGNPRLGPFYYPLFRAQTGLSESPKAVAVRAQKALQARRQEAAAHCRAIWPKYLAESPMPTDDKEVLRQCFARIERDQAKSVAEFVDDYRKLVAAAKKFVKEKGFFTLPSKLEIKIDSSPGYLGGAAVGGIYPPGPFAPESPSLLFVPAPPANTPPEVLGPFFQDFNHHFNVMITPHETVPGHAAQMTLAAHQPSKIRAIFANGPYVEGWGTFAERIMLDQGWGDELARVAHDKKQLENIARTIVDISVHTEGWTEEQATTFVQEEALQKAQFAGNMWNRTLRSPTQITTYWIGYQQIADLYEEAKAKKGDAFVLKEFLDGMMKLGPVPVHRYRQVIFPPPPPNPPQENPVAPAARPTGGGE